MLYQKNDIKSCILSLAETKLLIEVIELNYYLRRYHKRHDLQNALINLHTSTSGLCSCRITSLRHNWIFVLVCVENIINRIAEMCFLLLTAFVPSSPNSATTTNQLKGTSGRERASVFLNPFFRKHISIICFFFLCWNLVLSPLSYLILILLWRTIRRHFWYMRVSTTVIFCPIFAQIVV